MKSKTAIRDSAWKVNRRRPRNSHSRLALLDGEPERLEHQLGP
jgi:hypothetical protein